MENFQKDFISSEEDVARLLHQNWIVDGILQQSAYVLNEGETYISVNRPAIETYDSDVSDFIDRHPSFKSSPRSDTYRRAMLHVGDVRSIDIHLGDEHLSVSVDVEPRAMHTRSHAGIFTRVDGITIKPNRTHPTSDGEFGMSTDAILMKVRFHLLSLSIVETKPIVYE